MSEPVQAKNGALRDPQTGRFVPGGKVSTAIASPSQARALVARKMELKQQAVADAANLVVALDAKTSRIKEVRDLVGDDQAYIKAIAMGRTKAAMDSDSPYGNAAADWVFTHAGLMEPKQAQAQAPITALSDGYDIVAMILRRRVLADDIIDVIPMRSDLGQDTDG